jgi:hypothetical protein
MIHKSDNIHVKTNLQILKEIKILATLTNAPPKKKLPLLV